VPAGRRAVLAIGCELTLWDPLLLRWLLWMRRSVPDVAVRAHVGSPETLLEQVSQGIVDIGVVYAPRYRAGLKVELLVEERLVMVQTPRGPSDGEGDYVQVDWGAEFTLQHAKLTVGHADPALFVDLGPLGLDYLLKAGGTGYFRLSAVQAHLRIGRLQLVADAPDFPYPAYAVFSEAGGHPTLMQQALAGLRFAARFEDSEQTV
jgi:DNA-binding transcriptional LysR family regulator